MNIQNTNITFSKIRHMTLAWFLLRRRSTAMLPCLYTYIRHWKILSSKQNGQKGFVWLICTCKIKTERKRNLSLMTKLQNSSRKNSTSSRSTFVRNKTQSNLLILICIWLSSLEQHKVPCNGDKTCDLKNVHNIFRPN
jgi:hypothetical protein